MSLPSIEISWEADEAPPELGEDRLRTALGSFLQGLGRETGEISLLMAGDKTLAALNHRFRQINHPTDVLSWSYEAPEGGATLSGEIALSLEHAAAQALENGWGLETEVLRLLAHACAHLAGYDHQTPEEEAEMCGVETELLAKVGLKNIYPA